VTRLGPALAVPAAAIASNALAYGLLLAAARLLPHRQYGSFVALTTIIVVGAIPSLALQAVAARRVASGEGTDGVGTVTLALALATGALLAVLAVPLDAFLHIDSRAATLWLAASLVPLTLSGPQIGVAQGAERLTAFAAMSLLQALGRFGGTLVGLAMGRSEAAAMAGAAIGTAAVVAVAVLPLRHLGLAVSRTPRAVRSVSVEAVHALHGYAAVLVLTGLDLLLARHALGSEQAAQYAAGSVVTKAVVWLPQSIGLIVFARMASHEQHRRVVRRAVVIVAGIGLLAVAACALLGGLVETVIGGGFSVLRSYAWLFALLGTALAVIQFTVVAGLAARDSTRLVVLWAAVALEVVVVLSLGFARATEVAVGVTVVVGAAAAVAVWLAVDVPARRHVSVPSPAS
jgi:O-antigen/teichoic acid export membrane protein